MSTLAIAMSSARSVPGLMGTQSLALELLRRGSTMTTRVPCSAAASGRALHRRGADAVAVAAADENDHLRIGEVVRIAGGAGGQLVGALLRQVASKKSARTRSPNPARS